MIEGAWSPNFSGQWQDPVMIRLSLFLTIATAVILLSCAGLKRSSRSAFPTAAISRDGKCRVELPDGWGPLEDLHDDADLQVGNRKRETYLIVLSEPRSSFADDVTCQDHARMTLKTLRSNLERAKVVKGPTELTIKGRPAVQYEVHGIATRSRLKIAYLHTTIAGDQHFHQVLAWTLQSRLKENRGELERAINSFSEESGG